MSKRKPRLAGRAAFALAAWMAGAVAGCDRRDAARNPPPPPVAAPARSVEPPPSSSAPIDAAPATKPAPVLAPVPTTRPLRPAAYTLKARDLDAEYRADREAAVAKYKDRVVEVTGEVRSIQQTRDGQAFVILDRDVGSATENGLNCYTVLPRPWAVLAKGQVVVLRGVGNADPFGFPLLDCELTAAGPSGVVVATAERMAAQWDAGRAAFDKLYDEVPAVHVSGVVKSVEPGKDETLVRLAGSAATDVTAMFLLPLDRESVRDLKAGQTITVYSPRVGWYPRPVRLDYCMLIKP